MEQLIDFHAPEVQAVLDTLLKDKSTGKNIIWATDPPEELQTVMYEPVTDRSQITTQQLGLTHYEVVLPRMMKQTDTQQQRTRKKGEVFSPAWVCNKMNNALDADWFRGLGAGETAGQFTVELPQGWQTVETPVQFPACKGKTPAWVQYVQSRRLEVTCGEAPFLVSRYDAATGEMIPVARRIGILDRKLRVVSENAATEDEWRKYATHAVQSTYGYEYQGDNLLLARVNLLLTYAEHLQARWQRYICQISSRSKRIRCDFCNRIWYRIGCSRFCRRIAEQRCLFGIHQHIIFNRKCSVSIFNRKRLQADAVSKYIFSQCCQGCWNGNALQRYTVEKGKVADALQRL